MVAEGGNAPPESGLWDQIEDFFSPHGTKGENWTHNLLRMKQAL